MRPLRRVAVRATETRVFLLMAVFGLAVGVVYWFLSYEVAGTVLLIGFGLATAVIAAKLAVDRGPRRLARPVAPAADAGSPDAADRPFADDTGRLPDATIAPFAVGAGVALAALGLVFGLAPVIVGLLPLGWGALTWLESANEELAATQTDDASDATDASNPVAPETAAPAR
jgi:hypothetical protein